MLRIKPNAIDSEKIRWHAIEAADIDTDSITSRIIRNHTIQGEDINPETVITARAMDLSGNLDMQNNLILNIGNAGTDFTNTGGLILAGNLTVNGAGTNYFAGNVGIGTTNPTQKLDISGKIALDGTVIAYRPTTMTGTLILGNGGTNLSHTTGNTGYYNTFVGIDSGNTNTTGHHNTAIGTYSFYSNTTGYNNTANGYASLYANTTGTQNTANGMSSLTANTTGVDNTANGYASLYYNTTGSYNTAIGIYSGRFIANGVTANQTSDSSLYLGYSTKALADGDTNEIVIGANAIGNGSNSVTLGNTSITKTILRGNVGIGTTVPGAYLDINPTYTGATIGTIYNDRSGFTLNHAGNTITNYYGKYISAPTVTAGTITNTYALVTETNAGNVGIGMTAPTALLHLNGSAGKVSLEINSNETTAGSNVLMLRSDVASADDPIFRVQANGLVYADGAYASTGADYAEYFYTENTDLKSGEAVCVDTQNDNAVKRCQNSGDNNIMGIVSTKPSIIGNKNSNQENDPDHYKVIGMIGQVSGLISNENGNISIGDSLTSAGLKGYLRKANAGESTVGVAMQDFSKSTGTIQILISRRNQSLTVEKVEEAVTQNIKDMNVKDQVDKIVAEAKTNLDQQMASQTQDIASLQKLNINLQEQVDDIKSAMYVERFDELWNFYMLFKPESLENIVFKENGNINLLEGKITAKDIEALNTIKAKDIEATNNLKGDNLELGKSTRGKGVIKSGETEAKIETPYASKDAQIYLTPLSKLDGGNLYVDMENIKEGENFTVKLDGNSSDKDIEFNWLIIK